MKLSQSHPKWPSRDSNLCLFDLTAETLKLYATVRPHPQVPTNTEWVQPHSCLWVPEVSFPRPSLPMTVLALQQDIILLVEMTVAVCPPGHHSCISVLAILHVSSPIFLSPSSFTCSFHHYFPPILFLYPSVSCLPIPSLAV